MKLLRTLAVLALAGSSITCAPTIPKYTIHYSEFRATLDNGLRFVILPDKNTSMVHVAVRYQVGANEDPPGKAGLAHLVEHMMFQHRFLGPDKPPTFELIPQIATGFNAYTVWDQTHYYLDGRKEDVDAMLRLEAARMGAICNTIPPAEFDREREVVRNEIRQRMGTPEGQVLPIVLAEAYPPGHAYHEYIGGNDSQLASITFDDVCQFMKDYYTPSRATVIVAGNVDPEDIKSKIAFDFGAIAKREPKPRKKVDPIPEYKRRKVVKEVDLERSQLWVVWRMPPQESDEWTAASIGIGTIAGYLAGQNDDYGFAASVGGGAGGLGGELAPIGYVVAELYDADDESGVLDWVGKAVKWAHRPLEQGMTEEDTIARGKANLIMGLETLNERAEFIANEVQFRGNRMDFNAKGQEYLFHELEEIEKEDPGKFRGLVKSTFSMDKALVVLIKSSKKGIRGDKRAALNYSPQTHKSERVPVIDPAEAKRPLPAPETQSVVSTAIRYQLGNGMKVVLLPYDAMPIITVQLMFAAGGAQEPSDRLGLAQLAAQMTRPPPDADFTRTGVRIFGQAGLDQTWFYARGISVYDEQLIKGLERTIKVAEYRQEIIDSFKKYMKVILDSKREARQRTFELELNKLIYGPEHPYAVKGDFTEQSIGRMGRDVAMGWKRHYSAHNGTLIVVGDFQVDRVKKIISDNFGSWGGGQTDTPVPPTQLPRTGPEYMAVVDPEAPPSEHMTVSIAYPAPAGIDGQQAARQVLVGMLNLKLATIRTELGSTYGTYAFRITHVGPSAYVMGGTVDSARAGESLKAMRDKIDSLRRGEDFDRDFAIARREVLKRLLAEGGNTQDLSQRLAQIAAYNLPPDYYDQQVKFVAAVSEAQVRALIDQELKPENEIVACMHTRETLQKAFAEAGIDDVRYIEPK